MTSTDKVSTKDKMSELLELAEKIINTHYLRNTKSLMVRTWRARYAELCAREKMK